MKSIYVCEKIEKVGRKKERVIWLTFVDKDGLSSRLNVEVLRRQQKSTSFGKRIQEAIEIYSE